MTVQNTSKFLNNRGLETLWGKIQGLVQSAVEALNDLLSNKIDGTMSGNARANVAYVPLLKPTTSWIGTNARGTTYGVAIRFRIKSISPTHSVIFGIMSRGGVFNASITFRDGVVSVFQVTGFDVITNERLYAYVGEFEDGFFPVTIYMKKIDYREGASVAYFSYANYYDYQNRLVDVEFPNSIDEDLPESAVEAIWTGTARYDHEGNTITEKYATKTELAGKATSSDIDNAINSLNVDAYYGLSTQTITAISQSGGKINVTYSDIPIMSGASDIYGGSWGFVPAPHQGDGGKFLRGDGVWSSPQCLPYMGETKYGYVVPLTTITKSRIGKNLQGTTYGVAIRFKMRSVSSAYPVFFKLTHKYGYVSECSLCIVNGAPQYFYMSNASTVNDNYALYCHVGDVEDGFSPVTIYKTCYNYDTQGKVLDFRLSPQFDGSTTYIKDLEFPNDEYVNTLPEGAAKASLRCAARYDDEGNIIAETYLTKADVKPDTISITTESQFNKYTEILQAGSGAGSWATYALMLPSARSYMVILNVVPTGAGVAYELGAIKAKTGSFSNGDKVTIINTQRLSSYSFIGTRYSNIDLTQEGVLAFKNSQQVVAFGALNEVREFVYMDGHWYSSNYEQ